MNTAHVFPHSTLFCHLLLVFKSLFIFVFSLFASYFINFPILPHFFLTLFLYFFLSIFFHLVFTGVIQPDNSFSFFVFFFLSAVIILLLLPFTAFVHKPLNIQCGRSLRIYEYVFTAPLLFIFIFPHTTHSLLHLSCFSLLIPSSHVFPLTLLY